MKKCQAEEAWRFFIGGFFNSIGEFRNSIGAFLNSIGVLLYFSFLKTSSFHSEKNSTILSYREFRKELR